MDVLQHAAHTAVRSEGALHTAACVYPQGGERVQRRQKQLPVKGNRTSGIIKTCSGARPLLEPQPGRSQPASPMHAHAHRQLLPLRHTARAAELCPPLHQAAPRPPAARCATRAPAPSAAQPQSAARAATRRPSAGCRPPAWRAPPRSRRTRSRRGRRCWSRGRSCCAASPLLPP